MKGGVLLFQAASQSIFKMGEEVGVNEMGEGFMLPAARENSQ
jgi:hypothetical protein